MPRSTPPPSLLQPLLAVPRETREKEVERIAKSELGPQLMRELFTRVDELVETLETSGQTIEKLSEINHQLTAPPLHPAVFLGLESPLLETDFILTADDPALSIRARVAHQNREYLVTLSPDADRSRLRPGCEVQLNHTMNAIVKVSGRAAPHDCTIARFERALSDGRIEVTYRDEQLIVTCADKLDSRALRSGELVIFDRQFRMAFEKLDPPAAQDPLLTFETPDVPASSIGGQHAVYRKLRAHIMAALHAPDKSARYGLGGRRMILLNGAPGNGKTLSVRAIASEFTRSGKRTRVRVVKLGEIVSPYIGETERNIARLFAAARRAAAEGPVLLFLDEIEAIGRHRGGLDGHHFDRFLTCFLVELDGFTRIGDVCVIGATNRKDLLDAALLSRFSVQIALERPGLQAAREIFSVHLNETLPFRPNGDRASLTRSQIIETAVSLIFSPNNTGAQLVRLRFRDSKERIIHARELVSGRLIESISENARSIALERDMEGGEPGLCVTDIEDAVAAAIENLRTTLSIENARHYIADLPQDIGIVACEPIRPKINRNRHLLRP